MLSEACRTRLYSLGCEEMPSGLLVSPSETRSRRTSLTRDRLEAQGDLVTHTWWVQDLLALARATVNHKEVEVHGRVGRHRVHNARLPRARHQTLRAVRESGGNDEPPPAFLFHAERARIRTGGNTVRRRAQRPLVHARIKERGVGRRSSAKTTRPHLCTVDVAQ